MADIDNDTSYPVTTAPLSTDQVVMINKTTGLLAKVAFSNFHKGLTVPICVVRRAAALEIANETTTAITFDTEDVDTGSFIDISGAPTRISLTRKGYYLFSVWVEFASDDDGFRLVTMPRTGGGSDHGVRAASVAGAATTINFSFITGLRAATDYYQISAWHNAGAAINITARVAAVLLYESA